MGDEKQLMVVLSPKDGESLLSLLQRHCEQNATELQSILRLLAQDAGASRVLPRSVATDKEILRALEVRIGLPRDALAYHYLQSYPGPEKRLRQRAYELSEHVLVPRGQPVCPLCLRDDGYARSSWEYVQAPVCTRHGIPLLHACPSCHQPLLANRSHVCACGACGFDLREATSEKQLSESAVAVAHLVQNPKMIPGGVQSYSAPLDPQDLSDILRLATLPIPGAPWDYALVGSLHSVAVPSMVDALELVGKCLSGRQLDTARLRRELLRRWPYCERLPRTEKMRLLMEASGLMSIPLETSNLIWFDSETTPFSSAAERYGSKIPRLFTRRDVLSFLAIEPTVLDGLERSGYPLQVPLPGDGYDLDEVLEVQRAWRTAMSLSEVDESLGVGGLTQALVKLRLLRAIRDDAGTMSVLPCQVSALFSKIQGALLTDAGEVAGVPLQEVAFAHGQEFLAWLISQIVTGSLCVLAWDAPFSIGSLRVDPVRLAQLQDWPASEALSVEPPHASARRAYIAAWSEKSKGAAEEASKAEK